MPNVSTQTSFKISESQANNQFNAMKNLLISRKLIGVSLTQMTNLLPYLCLSLSPESM